MKIFKSFCNVISSIATILILLIAIFLINTKIMGLNQFTVLSGSMEPSIHIGSLLFVEPVEPTEISDGTIITYAMSETTVVTHRVTDVVELPEDPGVLRFQTKGDANEFKDASLVHEKNVIGVPKFVVPYAGFLANYLQSNTRVLSIIFILIAGFSIASDWLFDKDEDKADEDAKKGEGKDADEGADKSEGADEGAKKDDKTADSSDKVESNDKLADSSAKVESNDKESKEV